MVLPSFVVAAADVVSTATFSAGVNWLPFQVHDSENQRMKKCVGINVRICLVKCCSCSFDRIFKARSPLSHALSRVSAQTLSSSVGRVALLLGLVSSPMQFGVRKETEKHHLPQGEEQSRSWTEFLCTDAFLDPSVPVSRSGPIIILVLGAHHVQLDSCSASV